PEVLQKLLDCALTHHLDEVSPVVCNINNPETLAFPLRRGLVWRRKRSELFADGETSDLLPGIASLMNGALFSAAAIDAVGVPDLRL
ncbi:galactofuranosyl transferase, partial [Priestia sp. SIMBA_032]